MAAYCELNEEELRVEMAQVSALYEEYKAKGLKLDMSRGKPAANQLDLSLGLLTQADYIDETGVDARNYGMVEGIPEARKYFAQLIGAQPEETIVGGASSLNMMYHCIDLGWRLGYPESSAPWGKQETVKFLCPSPGYDRHFLVTEKFGFELIMVPMLETGPDMDIVEELVKDPAVKGIWAIPVYSNPDGYVYSAETVKRLATMQTASADFKIMWDNAYLVHHLTSVHNTCPNILAECKAAGNANRPIMFCSTSKVTFAGAGVSALATSEQNVKAIVEYLSVMTICFDKLNQLRHVRFLQAEGGIDVHMQKHAAILKPKFDKVQEILHNRLDNCAIASWTNPEGGYFVSFYAMPGTAKRIVQLCKEAGVVLTGAGAAFPYGQDPNDTHIRIAPSFPPIDELEQAAELLCIATRLASAEKLLQG